MSRNGPYGGLSSRAKGFPLWVKEWWEDQRFPLTTQIATLVIGGLVGLVALVGLAYGPFGGTTTPNGVADANGTPASTPTPSFQPEITDLDDPTAPTAPFAPQVLATSLSTAEIHASPELTSIVDGDVEPSMYDDNTAEFDPQVGDQDTVFRAVAVGFEPESVVTVRLTLSSTFERATPRQVFELTASETGIVSWAWQWKPGDPVDDFYRFEIFGDELNDVVLDGRGRTAVLGFEISSQKTDSDVVSSVRPRLNNDDLVLDDAAWAGPITVAVLANDLLPIGRDFDLGLPAPEPPGVTEVREAWGIVRVSPDQTLEVVLQDPKDTSTHSFRYSVYDRDFDRLSIATVNLSHESTQPGPKLEDDWIAVRGDASSILIENVTENDYLPEGSEYLVRIVHQPSGGTVTLVDGGPELLFRPDEDWAGFAAFNYWIESSTGSSYRAVITLVDLSVFSRSSNLPIIAVSDWIGVRTDNIQEFTLGGTKLRFVELEVRSNDVSIGGSSTMTPSVLEDSTAGPFMEVVAVTDRGDRVLTTGAYPGLLYMELVEDFTGRTTFTYELGSSATIDGNFVPVSTFATVTVEIFEK